MFFFRFLRSFDLFFLFLSWMIIHFRFLQITTWWIFTFSYCFSFFLGPWPYRSVWNRHSEGWACSCPRFPIWTHRWEHQFSEFRRQGCISNTFSDTSFANCLSFFNLLLILIDHHFNSPFPLQLTITFGSHFHCLPSFWSNCMPSTMLKNALINSHQNCIIDIQA